MSCQPLTVKECDEQGVDGSHECLVFGVLLVEPTDSSLERDKIAPAD
ncbi:hypothetical protein NOJ05_01350 [Neorhizobium galegae]|nr:hypothetical protein [Neorhizobium galegae]MCQ1775842.1 hypothetical protein [Neorhizobium galegae]MCQ1797983.1 hypothetical protein [Neorhizobium galegae]